MKRNPALVATSIELLNATKLILYFSILLANTQALWLSCFLKQSFLIDI